jgi:Fe-S cluster assembly iron-binding protein IscA
VLNPQFSEDGKPLLVSITPRAAHRLNSIMAKDTNPGLVLRVTVESGGCHGFQYLMTLTDTGKMSLEEDTLFVYEKEGIANSQPSQNSIAGKLELIASGKPKVVMDSSSLELLEGSKIDYTMELIGSQFKIVDNPRATSSCGCGTSFDVNI